MKNALVLSVLILSCALSGAAPPFIGSESDFTKHLKTNETIGAWQKALGISTVDIRLFGSKGDGVTDDSAAFAAAIASLPNGGAIDCPPGIYRVNIQLTANVPITIRGMGGSSVFGNLTRFIPANTDDWLIRIGNDSSQVRGIKLQDITFEASRPNGGCGKYGVFFSGGSCEAVMQGCAVNRFLENGVKVEAGTNYLASSITFLNTWFQRNSTNSGSYLLVKQGVDYGTAWTTDINFIGCHADASVSTNGYVMEMDSAEAKVIGGHWDLGMSGRGLKFSKSFAQVPKLRGANCALDCGNATNVLATVYNTSHNVSEFFVGDIDMGGLMSNATNGVTNIRGSRFGSYQDFIAWPYVFGSLSFQDPNGLNPWDTLDGGNRHRVYAYNDTLSMVTGGTLQLASGSTNLVRVTAPSDGFQSDPGARFGGVGGVIPKLGTVTIYPGNTNDEALYVLGYSSGGVTSPAFLTRWKDPNYPYYSCVTSDGSIVPHRLNFYGVFPEPKVQLACTPVFTGGANSQSPFGWEPVWSPNTNAGPYNFYSWYESPRFQGTNDGGYFYGRWLRPIHRGWGHLTGLYVEELGLDVDNGGSVGSGVMLHIVDAAHSIGGSLSGISIDRLTNGTNNWGIYNDNSLNFFRGLNVGGTTDPGPNTIIVAYDSKHSTAISFNNEGGPTLTQTDTLNPAMTTLSTTLGIGKLSSSTDLQVAADKTMIELHSSGWNFLSNATTVASMDLSGNFTVNGLVVNGPLTVNSTNDTTTVSNLVVTGTILLSPITKVQKTALTPSNGTLVYQSDNTPGLRAYVNGAWVMLSTVADP